MNHYPLSQKQVIGLLNREDVKKQLKNLRDIPGEHDKPKTFFLTIDHGVEVSKATLVGYGRNACDSNNLPKNLMEAPRPDCKFLFEITPECNAYLIEGGILDPDGF